jgi:hypothetical protein
MLCCNVASYKFSDVFVSALTAREYHLAKLTV